MFIYFIFISIALSIDALGIGISYRLNGVIIPRKSKIVIGIVTMVIMFGSLMIGRFFHNSLPEQLGKILGSSVLILIGALFIRNSLSQDEKATYDFDNSRTIETFESILLAIALSADSVGAGIAVASTGINSYILGILVGVMQLIFLFLADYLFHHVDKIRSLNQKICGLISGALLIIIGITRCLG